MNFRTTLARTTACAALLALPLSSHAIFRAYLSSKGDDANPCTLQEPCRLLPRALEAVDDNGEIWIMDSANYNTTTVNIMKSVSILAVPGAVGSVVTTGGSAILVNAPGITVSLRNLVIGRLGDGTGVHIAGGVGTRVHMEGCLVERANPHGIVVSGKATLALVDTTVRANVQDGVRVLDGTLHMTRSRAMHNGQSGVAALPAGADHLATAHIDEVVSMGNETGFMLDRAALGRARMYVTRSVASGNSGTGFYAFNSSADPNDAIFELSASAAHDNGYLGFYGYNASVRSGQNNRAEGNNDGGTQTQGGISPTSSF